MKKLFFSGLIALSVIKANAQVYHGSGGSILPNAPTTNLNVGIGTSNPLGKFQVENGIGKIAMGQFNPGVAPYLANYVGWNAARDNLGTWTFDVNTTNNGGAVIATDIDGIMQFITVPSNGSIGSQSLSDASVIANTRMTITNKGYVGINTTTPLHKLHVHDGAVMISGAFPGGGPMILFSDDITANGHPGGRWGVEYMNAEPSRPSMEGLNFWKPWPNISGWGNYYMFLKNDGKIGMGVTDDNNDPNYCGNVHAFPNGYRLYVNGGILTTKVKVAVYCSNNWSDYVFANDYKLKPLQEVEAFVKANKHLPGMLSAEQMVKEGNDLGATDAKLLEKIEELTLYLIELNKKVTKLETENTALKSSFSNFKQ